MRALPLLLLLALVGCHRPERRADGPRPISDAELERAAAEILAPEPPRCCRNGCCGSEAALLAHEQHVDEVLTELARRRGAAAVEALRRRGQARFVEVCGQEALGAEWQSRNCPDPM